jgi:hypothetical protein
MGVFNTSLPEHVFAFENAALRDAWVAMLQVRLCVFLHLFAIALAFTLHVCAGDSSGSRCSARRPGGSAGACATRHPPLQAAAAARIAGQPLIPDIIAAAVSGDLALVQDHLTSDPSCVGRRDGE